MLITEPMWTDSGTLVDGSGGLMFDGRRFPRTMGGNPAFSPIPPVSSGMLDVGGAMYQAGGNQTMASFHQPSMGYGMLGPTLLINNNTRPPIPFQSGGHRPGE